MTGRHPLKSLTERFTPDRAERVTRRAAELRAEMALHEIRQALQHSQAELARALKVNQPAVAKLERRADMYVSNLRRYVEALGGKLEITAKFPEGNVVVRNFGDLTGRTD